MKKVVALMLPIVLLLTSIILPGTPVRAVNWTAKWIWQSDDGPNDTWMCFRKTFNISNVPATVTANIAVDSRYDLWINGVRVIREGGLKRGPEPGKEFYDEVDLKPYLTTGDNTIAILVWYWGIDRMDVVTSGKGGLLFQADLGGTSIISDNTWKVKIHPAFKHSSDLAVNWLMAEYNIVFDARDDLPGWYTSGYDDSGWSAATEKGVPPSGPWGDLIKRPLPQWKYYGLSSYTDQPSLPYTSNGSLLFYICQTISSLSRT